MKTLLVRLDETGYSYQTLRTAKYVSSKIEFFTRVKDLSWRFHLEVASLDSEQQRELLDKAVKEQLSVRELRTAKYVSGNISLSYRYDNLTWTHHFQVASLEPKLQTKLLREPEKYYRKNTSYQ